VADAEADIAAHRAPEIAGDSYLEVGWFISQLALTYDYGYTRLTEQQRARWVAFANQAIFNVWNPNQASWGGEARTWSGWGTCDPGNNYHFSFLKATMLWALATQNQEWITYLQTRKYPPLLDYYNGFPDGGTREGTGYGTAIGSLFNNYLFWKGSTNENLAGLTPHVRETIDYWVNATVPTRDIFAPIGDLSRESIPHVYDYHENLVHQAVVLAAPSAEAGRGTWWLQNNSLDSNNLQTFNVIDTLLPYPVAAVQPTDLVYHATGAGVLFARSSWEKDATFMHLMAGQYDQSHAHQDQGSFSFYKRPNPAGPEAITDWLSVTANIWSLSGIHQETTVQNSLRFERANGTVIPQNQSSTQPSSMTYTTAGGVMTAVADLKNAFSSNRASVASWTRTIDFPFAGSFMRVHDVCSVAAGVKPVFQLQVTAQPVEQPDHSIIAGHLKITPIQPVTATFVNWGATTAPVDPVHPTDPEKEKWIMQGWRIDLRPVGAGCEFSIELRAQ
jgi:hypothetical protein